VNSDLEKINSFVKSEDLFPEFDKSNAVVVKDVGYQHSNLFLSLLKEKGLNISHSFAVKGFYINLYYEVMVFNDYKDFLIFQFADEESEKLFLKEFSNNPECWVDWKSFVEDLKQ
jgi:hypothetical protein